MPDTAAVTLKEVGRRVGYNYTTISRLRSGDRMPSTRLLAAICTEFNLDEGEALRVLSRDQQRSDGKAIEFSAWLRKHVFKDVDTPAA